MLANDPQRFRYVRNGRVHDVHRHGGVFRERAYEFVQAAVCVVEGGDFVGALVALGGYADP